MYLKLQQKDGFYYYKDNADLVLEIYITITAPMRTGDKGLARLVQFTDDKDQKM